MKFSELPMKGAYQIEPTPFEDHRGKFARIFCAEELVSIGLSKSITQANISMTKEKGCIRGMHFQYPPHAEIKVVRCIQGAIFDVLVDLRKDSKTFQKWYGVELTPEKMNALYIPEGFAHGFQALENNSTILYMVTAAYSPKSEGGLNHADPTIDIKWPLPIGNVSERMRVTRSSTKIILEFLCKVTTSKGTYN